MKKDISIKARKFFVKMGKEHKMLMPLAVVCLALTMFWSALFNYIINGYKRFACVVVVLCLFFIGNSFAFPSFNLNRSFQAEKRQEKKAADYSHISLSNSNTNKTIVIEETDLSSEKGDVGDTYSLEDILNENDVPTAYSITEENKAVKFDESDTRLILINKQHPIPEDYEFKLGTLSGSMQCDERVIADLLLMMTAADEEGIKLVICSPYRDDSKQEKLFNRKIDNYMSNGYSYMEAYKLAGQAVTVPGSSEHQVGLSLDIVSNKYSLLEEGFGKTEAGIWLKDNCSKYGFIIRYPKDKEAITGIEYEPWHFRYVGKEAANIIMSEGLCLEEFWDKYM